MSDCKILVYRSSIHICSSYRKYIRDVLQEEENYAEILTELETGERQEMIKKKKKKSKERSFRSTFGESDD